MIERSFTDLLEHIVDNRGRTCPTADSGLPLIATNCIKDDRLYPVFENVRYVDEETVNTWFRGHPQPKDIIFVCKGSPGRVAMVPDPVSFCIAQDMVALRADDRLIQPRYLYYALKSPAVQAKINNMHVGSMIPHFKKGDFGKLRFSIHEDMGEQQAIAEVLGALDDKIAGNTKLAVTADEWVRASLASLTASAEETMPVRELVANRKELAEPSTLDPASRYLGLEHLPRRSMWASSAGTAESVTSTKAKFKRGDILFGKLRPYFHKVVIAPYDGVCSTDILVLKPSNRELAGFTLASVASDFMVERATAASEGTRMPRTSWNDLASIEVPWPGVTEAKEFSARVSAVRSSVESLLGENQTFAETRDALLPQLMSGKLQVKDAEKVLENAGV
jgi:type I restriction enzyme S subunit